MIQEKIKIVHITESLGGGVLNYITSLIYYLNNNLKFDCYFIYSLNRNEITLDELKLKLPLNVHLIELEMVNTISFFKDLNSIINLKNKINEINPDIIHLHSSKAGIIGKIGALFSVNSAKVFYSPHGYSFMRKDISVFKRFIFLSIEFIFGKIIYNSTTIACGDTEYKNANYISKSILNRNGINISEVEKYFVNYSNNKLTIGILGRITFARDPQLFNKIALKYPEINFVWIGDGELKHELTAKNIKITGWIKDSKKVYQELNQLDIYLHTSLWEGLPLAILEAMALKKPIVATNVIGNKDIVLNNETGFLFQTIEDLDFIFKYLSNQENRTQIGSSAYKRCCDTFSAEKNFKELLQVYLNS